MNAITQILIACDHKPMPSYHPSTYLPTGVYYTYRQFNVNEDTYMYINVSVRNYFNAEVEGCQSSHPAVNIRSLQSPSVWFWGWKWDMKTPIENIDPRSYVMVEVNTYQKAVVDLSRKQSRQLSTSPINNYNNSKTKTKTSVVVPVTFSSKKSSDSNNNNNNNNGNILNQQHHSTTLESTPGNDKSRDSDCCWGVFVLDIPKLKYFSSSMIAVQPYPIPSPLNPTSRSNLSSHDYSRCLHLDIMLSKKEVDI